MREVRTRLWIGLGVSVLAGATAVEAALPPAAAPDVAAPAADARALPVGIQVATGPGEGGGGAVDATLLLLTDLQKMKGHLAGGLELLNGGNRQGAARQLGQPLSALYAVHKEILENRAVGFDAELSRLAALAANVPSPPAEIEAAAAAVASRIDAAANTYGSWSTRVITRRVEVARFLLQAAVFAYLDGVNDGGLGEQLENGRGHVLQARELINEVLADLRVRDADKAQQLSTSLDSVLRLWPSPAQAVAVAEDVLGAAARAELAMGVFAAQ